MNTEFKVFHQTAKNCRNRTIHSRNLIPNLWNPESMADCLQYVRSSNEILSEYFYYNKFPLYEKWVKTC